MPAAQLTALHLLSSVVLAAVWRKGPYIPSLVLGRLSWGKWRRSEACGLPFPARRAGTGRTERPIDASSPKPLALWTEKGGGPDWGRTQPTIPQAPRQPTWEVALPTTSWGLQAQASGLRQQDGATWATRRAPWARSPTEDPGTWFIKYWARCLCQKSELKTGGPLHLMNW